jgi:hypothetical protein
VLVCGACDDGEIEARSPKSHTQRPAHRNLGTESGTFL